MKPMWICDVCGTPANVFGQCPLGPHRKGEKKIVHPPMSSLGGRMRHPTNESPEQERRP